MKLIEVLQVQVSRQEAHIHQKKKMILQITGTKNCEYCRMVLIIAN